MDQWAEMLAIFVCEEAPKEGERTGQYLFNGFWPPIQEVIRGKLFDPFYKEYSYIQLLEWIKDHIIFDENGDPCGVFDGETILWEAP